PAQPVADSEPVIVVGDDGGDALSYRRLIQSFEPGTKLYRHPQPAPVVPDDVLNRLEHEANHITAWHHVDEHSCKVNRRDLLTLVNACRAAMLQAGTLTNEGTKQAWTGIPDIDNAINMLDRIDTLESCDDDRIEAVKTVLRGLAGNSPVIPDGSASMLRRWLAFGRGMQNAGSQLPHNLIAETESMLAAAPQPQNSPQNIPEIIPGWIPVSERMPEEGGRYWCYVEEQNSLGKSHYQWNCSWNEGAWSDKALTGRVTHWMPLPAAPQEVKSE
ncbi:TPA: DUF551 domain-containing protein, partial [Klebsiella pneumoniae]